MNLQELHENKKTVVVKRALREHYEINMDFDKLSLSQTHKMLSKIKGLLKEARTKNNSSHNNSAYLKLVMMEQALSDRLNDLRNPKTRIVVENEEVQKSQVILAAQDMIDTLQKMLEQISKMNVEELNAVVTGMKNEFGTAAGDSFNQSVSQALTTLQTAITSAKDSLSSSLGSVTGEGGAPAADMSMDIGAEMDAGMPDMGAEQPAMGPEEPMPAEEPAAPEMPEEPEPEDISGAGRERR